MRIVPPRSSMPRPRGRPRKYDPERALDAAMMLFWRRGFSATSLDDLSTEMKMNRPSLYHAFGDKEAIYRRALARMAGQMEGAVGATLLAETDLATALERFYDAALEVYVAGDTPLGCFVMCTAPAEALGHPEVRADLRSVIARIDSVLAKRFAAAQADGQLSVGTDTRAAARLAQAVLHSLAIRARSGASKAALRKMARQAVALLTGTARA